MTTIFIDNIAVPLPPLKKSGDVMDEVDADIIDTVRFRRVNAKLRWLLSRGEITPDQLQAKAIELCDAPLRPYSTLDDDDGEVTDPIMLEALSMAKELITKKMAEENLPPPRGLEDHAKALVDGMPEIQERARLRIEARYRAASAALEGVV